MQPLAHVVVHVRRGQRVPAGQQLLRQVGGQVDARGPDERGVVGDLVEPVDEDAPVDVDGAAAEHPGWGFEEHVGYSTPEHRAAIEKLGVSPLHRMSFQSMAYQQLALS